MILSESVLENEADRVALMVPLADNEKVRCRVAELLLLVMLSPLTLIDVTEADSTESEDVEEIDELSEGVDVLVSVWFATPWTVHARNAMRRQQSFRYQAKYGFLVVNCLRNKGISSGVPLLLLYTCDAFNFLVL